MKRTFLIRAKPVSINNFYYADKRHGVKPDAREMQQKIFHALSSPNYKQDLKELREHFNPIEHCYRVEIIVNVPKVKFFNSKGLISSRTLDNSNYEKGILDCLCLPKNFGPNSPNQAEQLNCDDKYVTELFSKKRPVDDAEFSLEITVEIIPLPTCPLK